MGQLAVSTLSSWQNFYVIVGSSAGALTGLQFVVIVLVAQSRTPAGMREIRAFSTPTVVHFCVALLIAAVMCAPWQLWWGVAACLGVAGILGLSYVLTALWHARKSTVYTPDFEDLIFYTLLPLLAYAALVTAGLLFCSAPRTSLFTVAGTTLLLLLIGIRNAWDTVTYIAVVRRETSNTTGSAGES
jgi:hypothetical protein